MFLRTLCAGLILCATVLTTGCCCCHRRCCHAPCCRPCCCSPCHCECGYAPPAEPVSVVTPQSVEVAPR